MMNHLRRGVWEGVVLMVFSIGILMGTRTDLRAEEVLTGSRDKWEEVVDSCKLIVVGKVTDSRLTTEAPAVESVHGAKVEVSQTLKGKVSDTLAISMNAWAGKTGESLPKAGGLYLFFLQAHPLTQDWWALKVMPATAEGVLAVRREIERPTVFLPGNRRPLNEVVMPADQIVVAKLLDMGLTAPDFPGGANFGEAKVKVTQTLRGYLTGTVTISITVMDMTGRRESVPKVGESYLFLLQTDPRTQRKHALRMMPVSDATLQAVQGEMRKPTGPLPGSRMKKEEAEREADVIVMAKLAELGLTVPSAPGMAVYPDAVIEAMLPTKGQVEGLQMVTIFVKKSTDVTELTPTVNQWYVFYLARKGSNLDVLKMLPESVMMGEARDPRGHLPGDSVAMKDAVREADLVVVATLQKLGEPMPMSPGETPYFGSKIEVTKMIKGSAKGVLGVTIRVEHRPDVAEETPKEGRRYVFFIKRQGSNAEVTKMLPAEDEVIATVTAEIVKRAK